MTLLQKISFTILISTLLFLVACKGIDKSTSRNPSVEKFDCSTIKDKLERTLCELYSSKSFAFDKKAIEEAADSIESKFSLLDIDAAESVRVNLDSAFLGKKITMEQAKFLEENGFNHRKQIENYSENPAGTLVPGRRHPVGTNYNYERSIYFDWFEIDNWLTAVGKKTEDGGHNIDKDRLGIRIYFGEYGSGDADDAVELPTSDHKYRSTVILRAMEIKFDGVHRIPVATNKTEVTYNLGGVCPPVCTNADLSDAPISTTSKVIPTVKPTNATKSK